MELNQNVDLILNGHVAYSFERRQLNARGSLDARSRGRFIRVRRKQRERWQHRADIMELLKECRRPNDEAGVQDAVNVP